MADVALTPKQLAQLLDKLDAVRAHIDAVRAVLFQAMADRRRRDEQLAHQHGGRPAGSRAVRARGRRKSRM